MHLRDPNLDTKRVILGKAEHVSPFRDDILHRGVDKLHIEVAHDSSGGEIQFGVCQTNSTSALFRPQLICLGRHTSYPDNPGFPSQKRTCTCTSSLRGHVPRASAQDGKRVGRGRRLRCCSRGRLKRLGRSDAEISKR